MAKHWLFPRLRTAKFDYEAAKQEIAHINAIVETCPEAVKEKCFELLFAAVFGKQTAVAKQQESKSTDEPEKKKQDEKPGETKRDRKLPSNVLQFARRFSVTNEELDKLFMLDHEPLLPIYTIPSGTKTATAQLYKLMMVLLENGLLNNQIGAPYTELRENVKQDGLYDGNFNGLLKRNHSLFKGAITKNAIIEGEAVELTGAGLQRLAEVVKELAGTT